MPERHVVAHCDAQAAHLVVRVPEDRKDVAQFFSFASTPTCCSGGSTSKDTMSVAYIGRRAPRSLARIPSAILATCCLIWASSPRVGYTPLTSLPVRLLSQLLTTTTGRRATARAGREHASGTFTGPLLYLRLRAHLRRPDDALPGGGQPLPWVPGHIPSRRGTLASP